MQSPYSSSLYQNRSSSHDLRNSDQKGLLWMLDEEAMFPGASDDSFMERLYIHFSDEVSKCKFFQIINVLRQFQFLSFKRTVTQMLLSGIFILHKQHELLSMQFTLTLPIPKEIISVLSGLLTSISISIFQYKFQNL